MKSYMTWLCCGLILTSGCSAWNVLNVRSQSPDGSRSGPTKARLVGDLAVPFGMFPIRVEAVGLVTGLQGTGSDPAPSPQRAALLEEMKTRDVKNPNTVLASSDTALVLLRGWLRPGIQKGDRFDIEVRIPSRSETSSLRGGYLLKTRLQEMAVLDGRFREGKLLALAKGPVLVDPSAEGNEDQVLSGRGRILGGGVTLKSRSLGLVLKPGSQNVFNASRVAAAVNQRFHSFHKGIKIGVAKGKTDEFIDLTVHPRYKDNINRYVQVVRAVALQESSGLRVRRIADLQDRLLDPAAAFAAALELEAIGNDGAEVLLEGIKSSEPEVRFHAAEALAYLDRREAAEPLGEIAHNQPAFRVFAMTALSAMDDFASYEQLRELLAVASAETRYGAFRALWAMNPGDALVLGERLGGQFSYHVLDTPGKPMIHVTRNRRPELVLFGNQQQFRTPLAVNAGNQIMVTSNGSDEIAVSKYAAGDQDQRRVVSSQVDDVIRAIVELGGTYPDVVQALQEAKSAGALTSRFEVDALPEAGRSYSRASAREQEKPEGEKPAVVSRAKGLSSLFAKRGGVRDENEGDLGGVPEKPDADSHDSAKRPHPFGGILARMVGRGAD